MSHALILIKMHTYLLQINQAIGSKPEKIITDNVK